jgi:hypothetical protein
MESIEKKNSPTVVDLEAPANECVNETKLIYMLEFKDSIPKHADFAAEFPTHPREDLRRLEARSFWRLASLNKELNRRCKGSIDPTSFTVGDVEFRGFMRGYIYIIWASMRIENVNEIEIRHDENAPVLVFTDGYGGYRGFYVFSTRKLLLVEVCTCVHGVRNKLCRAHDCQLIWPLGADILCLETERPGPSKVKPPLMRAEEAQDAIFNDIASTLSTASCFSSSEESDSDGNSNF